MKRLSLYLFLIFFTFQTPSWADDIRDFQIEGMSIGDSLLDYFSEKEIKNKNKIIYPSDDKFYGVEFAINDSAYESYGFTLKKDDNKFIIYQLKGSISAKFEKCLEKKKVAIKEIKEILTKVDENTYLSHYRKKMGKSFSEVTDLIVEDGSIRIWCENWDKNFSKSKNWINSFNVDASKGEYLLWLDTEAFK